MGRRGRLDRHGLERSVQGVHGRLRHGLCTFVLAADCCDGLLSLAALGQGQLTVLAYVMKEWIVLIFQHIILFCLLVLVVLIRMFFVHPVLLGALGL